MAKYEIRDDGDTRKYFTQLPNIVDDMDLSVYAFRLYVHLRRVAGENGQCWQSVETLAKACCMSTGMIGKAREELASSGLIKIERKPNPNGGYAFFIITIVDLWKENATKYASSSQYDVVSSQSEFAGSPHEIKNNPLNNNPIKIDDAAKPARPSRKKPTPEETIENQKAKALIDEFTELSNLKPVSPADWGKWYKMAKYLVGYHVEPQDLRAAYHHERQYGKNPISWIGSIKARAISQHRE